MQLIRRFLRQPFFIQCWAMPVWLLLGVSKLCILCLPFRVLAAHLGEHQVDRYWVPLITPQQCSRARLIGRLIRGIAPFTPWTSNCFPQALTALLLLRLYRIPSGLYLGVVKNGPKLTAHAWLCSGRVRVTGGFSFSQFTPVALFISWPKRLTQ